MKYSKYQEGVFDFVKNQTGNAIVQAVAGSGKTTTMEHAIKNHVPCIENVLACAFNKHIAEALKARMPDNVTSTTLNSFGYRATLQHFRGIKLEISKVDRVLKNILNVNWSNKDEVKEYYKVKSFICKMVDLLRNLNRSTTDDWTACADMYGITIPNRKDLDSLLRDTYIKVINDRKSMDFTDQLFYPVYHNIPLTAFDQVWVDETQDLNPIQIEMIRMVGGRTFAVGDTHQAIYGFRGADPFAMRTMKDQFGAIELPLSICYRCAKNVVLEAQKVVPHIEYADGAIDGVVDSVAHQFYVQNLADTDWVLSRTTAPLVKECLARIAEGRKAAVKGRDIGDNIINMLEDISDPCDITELGPKVQDYLDKKLTSLRACGRDVEAENVQDRVDTLKALMEGCSNTQDIINRVDNIFKDDSAGIMYATVHRSKGLETDRVWLLRPDLLPHPSAKLDWQKVQEQNLKYVAITRAKKEFYYVGDVLK